MMEEAAMRKLKVDTGIPAIDAIVSDTFCDRHGWKLLAIALGVPVAADVIGWIWRAL